MSCNVTKLEYLEETKRLFREKIDPHGKKITDETPFRDYVGMVTGILASDIVFVTNSVPQNLVAFGNATYEEITQEEEV